MHLPSIRLIEVKLVECPHALQNGGVPRVRLIEMDGGEMGVVEQRSNVLFFNETVLESIDEARVKRDGDITAVRLIHHMPRVQGIGVAKKSISLLDMVDTVVYLILHTSIQKKS